ncbi:Arginine kinase, partial [Trachymyrmex septentrionalis]
SLLKKYPMRILFRKLKTRTATWGLSLIDVIRLAPLAWRRGIKAIVRVKLQDSFYNTIIPWFQVQEALISLKDELKGTYYTLRTLDKQIRQQLLDDHFLFKKGDRFLKAANTIRFRSIDKFP